MPEWLERHLPGWAHGAVNWLVHPKVLIALAVVSVFLFFASVIGVPWFVSRVPSDYFSRRERQRMGMRSRPKSAVRMLGAIARNVVGYILLVLGVLMLVLPGQGVLAIIVALFLIDFPGKHRFERRIIAYAPVFRALNRLRTRAGRPPLERSSLS